MYIGSQLSCFQLLGQFNSPLGDLLLFNHSGNDQYDLSVPNCKTLANKLQN